MGSLVLFLALVKLTVFWLLGLLAIFLLAQIIVLYKKLSLHRPLILHYPFYSYPLQILKEVD